MVLPDGLAACGKGGGAGAGVSGRTARGSPAASGRPGGADGGATGGWPALRSRLLLLRRPLVRRPGRLSPVGRQRGGDGRGERVGLGGRRLRVPASRGVAVDRAAGAGTRRRGGRGLAHRHQPHGGQVDDVPGPLVLGDGGGRPRPGGRRPRSSGPCGRASRDAPGPGPRPRSRPGWRRRGRSVGQRGSAEDSGPQQGAADPDRRTRLGVDHAQPERRLARRDAAHARAAIANARPTSSTAPTTTRTAGSTSSSRKNHHQAAKPAAPSSDQAMSRSRANA